MIKSMTGFGRGVNEDNARRFIVEIKSVNHRYNNIVIKLPKHLSFLENNIKKQIKKKVKRGRVDIYIHLENIKDSDFDVKADLSLAESYKNAIEELCNTLDIKKEFSIELFTNLPEILKVEKKDEDEDEIWKCLKEALIIALDKLVHMRKKEGEKLAEDISNRGNNIKTLVMEIEKRAPEVVKEYKNKLEERIKDLIDNKYELDNEKLCNEVAYYADRSNITEEIVRLNSHINQLFTTLKSDNPVGRKLDFLVQEMNREINTIGSKAGDTDIKNNVVEIKSEIEKIREQVQNIE